MKTLNDTNFKGKRVLVRVDFNVPMNEQKEITDTTRITETLPTIHKILNDGGNPILMSHLGRPNGEINSKYSLAPVAQCLSHLLNTEVLFWEDYLQPEAIQRSKALKPGQVVLLENLRFYKEEEGADETFAKTLAGLGDAYVNDAFGTAHRAHASTAIIAKFFRQNKYFGFLLEKEVKALDYVLQSAKAPFTAIIGGAKVSSKMKVIKNLINRVDNLIIGGGMAYTFIKAMGGTVGNSLCEEKWIKATAKLVKEMTLKGVRLYLPLDSVCGDAFAPDCNVRYIDSNFIPDGWMGMDIGPKTIKSYAEVIQNSQTILWNGPMGVFEMKAFEKGTGSTSMAIATATACGAFSMIGGGDSVAAVHQFGVEDYVSYISTGGGAMLEYLEGAKLPGIKMLL